MEARSRKILLGILLASVHMKVCGIYLLPSCFGFVILYLGIHDLEKNGGPQVKQRISRKMHMAAGGLVLASALADYMGVIMMLGIGSIWRLVPSILEYAVFVYLMNLYCALKPSTAGLRQAYLLIMGAAVCGYGLSLILNSAVWQVFCLSIMLLGRVIVAKTAVCDRNPGK